MLSLRSPVAPLSALTFAAMLLAVPALAQQVEPGGSPPGGPQSMAPGAPPPPPGAPPDEGKGTESGGPMKSAYVPSRLNLRQAAGVDSAVVTVIPAGSTVQVADCISGWCAVEFEGQHGYAIATGLEVGGRVRHAGQYGPPAGNGPGGYGPGGYGPGAPAYGGGGPAYYGPPGPYYGAPYYYYGPRYYYYGPRWGYYYRPY
jgi:Bacterial SH3 domain